MIKRSFIGLAKPQLEYDPIAARLPEIKNIPTPKKVTLFLDKPYNLKDSILLKTGDKVKTGQKLSYSKNSNVYVTSTVTGTISSVYPFAGDYGTRYTAVSINVDAKEEIDDQFQSQASQQTLVTAENFLAGMPGNPSFKIFSDPQKPIHTIMVCAVERDLLLNTNQYV